MIGTTFVDCDENITFKITDVCTYNKAPGMLFFAYYDVSSDSNVNDLEYSECDEILAQKWCKLQ